MNRIILLFIALLVGLHGLAQQQSLNFTDDFEGSLNWTLINGEQTNRWFYGDAATSGNGNSLYITNNAGKDNNYTLAASSIVYTYRDISIPQGITEVNFEFEWKNSGETNFDYIGVYVVPTTYSPTAGIMITLPDGGTQIGGNFSGKTEWTTFNQIFNAASFAGGEMRLIFLWRNDAGGGLNPPGAVDNIKLSSINCYQPTALSILSVTDTTATIKWTDTSDASLWEFVLLPAGNPTPTAESKGELISENKITIDALIPDTAYQLYIRTICTDADKSLWTNPLNFKTTQIPTTLPWMNDFETENNLSLVNGTQANKWFYGSAVSNNSAYSLYISNNNGTNNTYTKTTASVVSAYKDIAVPDDATEAELSFDWKSTGEENFDYLNVWLVPVGYIPVAGIPTTEKNSGGLKVTGNLHLNPEWSEWKSIIDVSAYKGSTARLIFEWINDDYKGIDPPAAIDNISLSLITCPQPENISVNDSGLTSATISWTAKGTENSWELYIVPENSPLPDVNTNGIIISENPYTITGLTPGLAYECFLRTVCTDNDISLWTGPAHFETGSLCAAATNIETHCLDATNASFTWQPAETETLWEAVVLEASNPAPLTGTVVTTPSYYSDNLTVNTDYIFYVRAVCADANGYSRWTKMPFTTSAVSPARAKALCSGVLAAPQPSNHSNSTASYGSVGCLSSTPNPTWYYVTLTENGTVTLNLKQVNNNGNPIDVDFAAFGPFNSPADVCYSLGYPLNPSYITDCSFSPSASENITLSGNEGNVFAILVTNFNGSPGSVILTQTSGSEINCNPVVALGPDLVLCNTASYELTATVTNPGKPQPFTYTWYMDDNTTPFNPEIIATTNVSQTISVHENGTHNYRVEVTTPQPFSTTAIDAVTVSMSHPFTATEPPPLFLCSEDITAQIDLSSINFLGNLPATEYTISGIYSSETDAISGQNPINITTPFTAATQTLYISIADALVPSCKKVVPLSVIINQPVLASFRYAATETCETAMPLSPIFNEGAVAGTFSANQPGLALDATTGVIVPKESKPGTYLVTNTVAATTYCPIEISDTASITVNKLPAFTVNQKCNNGKYELTLNFDNDENYTTDNVTVAWYKNSLEEQLQNNVTSITTTEAGTYYVTITPQTNGFCQQIIKINVTDALCGIARGISPGSTAGSNDSFDLSIFNVRKLTIFNRSGKEVYSFNGKYTNQWAGQDSKGKDLPNGTYFYTIHTDSGENKTGWIYVNRNVK